MSEAVRMEGVVKRFPRVLALDRVSFQVDEGEIHALLGENGAGKTTLMNVLYGVYRPDEGEIRVGGNRVEIHSPQDAIRLGIGMIHQHFRLVPNHSVVENVVLGMPGDFLRPDRVARARLASFAQKYGLSVDPEAYIWQLSAGEQQRVEIIKALYRGAGILILDEPTSMLTPQEVDSLMSILERMAAEGHTIIFITHKLEEVMAVSHRVTVLRQGRVEGSLQTAQTNERALARMMVGREVLFRLEKRRVRTGPTVLRVERLRVLNDRGLAAVKDVSFVVKAGEIFGIAGVAGNGQRELVETTVGLRQTIQGRIRVSGQEVGYVPGERMTGLVPEMSVAENLILKGYRRPPFSQGPFLNPGAIRSFADQLISAYSVITPGRDTPVKLLSGGNLQRVLLAREISGNPALLIAVHPTSGLDVGATESIRQLLLAQRERGTAILLVSGDLEEVLTLSDRIGVMFDGELTGILPTQQADLETLGLMMAGVPLTD